MNLSQQMIMSKIHFNDLIKYSQDDDQPNCVDEDLLPNCVNEDPLPNCVD